jgi:7-cyano-7-deazaguanine synthase in queuosine biosynthesis
MAISVSMDRCLFFSPKMKEIGAFETSVIIDQTTQCYHPRRIESSPTPSENLKSCTDHLDGFTPQAGWVG